MFHLEAFSFFLKKKQRQASLCPAGADRRSFVTRYAVAQEGGVTWSTFFFLTCTNINKQWKTIAILMPF